MALTHWVCFLLFFQRTADVMAPRLRIVFRRLVRLDSFPACWNQVNVTPFPKNPLSSSVANYRPISMRSVLPKVFERMVSVRLGRFMERSVYFQPPSSLLERSGYLAVIDFCAVPYTAKFIDEWAGGYYRAD